MTHYYAGDSMPHRPAYEVVPYGGKPEVNVNPPPVDDFDADFNGDMYMCRDVVFPNRFGKKGKGKKGKFGGGIMSDKGLAADQMAQFKHFERDFGCCPFYLKIGACRHGDQCSRLHNRPVSSNTLLLQHVYPVPLEAYQVAVDEVEPEDYVSALLF